MKNPENLFLAHVRQDTSGEWIEHSLDDHLRGVARIAAERRSAGMQTDMIQRRTSKVRPVALTIPRLVQYTQLGSSARMDGFWPI